MPLKQAIVVRTDLGMGKGKIAAQASHASLEAMAELPPAVFEQWKGDGMKKIVLRVGSRKELVDLYKKAKKNLPASLVKDAGLTQVKAGTPTCIAIGPAEEIEVARLTGKLRLL